MHPAKSKKSEMGGWVLGDFYAGFVAPVIVYLIDGSECLVLQR